MYSEEEKCFLHSKYNTFSPCSLSLLSLTFDSEGSIGVFVYLLSLSATALHKIAVAVIPLSAMRVFFAFPMNAERAKCHCRCRRRTVGQNGTLGPTGRFLAVSQDIILILYI